MTLLNGRNRVNRRLRWIHQQLILFGAMVGSDGVMAQAFNGTLQYGPLGGGGPGVAGPTAIPTMGGAGLVLLSMFLLLVVWRMHRNGVFQGGRLMAVTLIGGALASGLGGVKLVGDAVAQAVLFRDMASPSGGTLAFEPSESACVRNATGVPLRVLSMNSVGGFVQTEQDCGPNQHGAGDHPGCGVGSVLAPGEVCGALADDEEEDGQGQEPPETFPETHTEQLVGAEGGVLQVDDVVLTIPAGALDSEVNIGMVISPGPIHQANGSLALSSPLVTLTPHGQSFAVPVTLNLPYSLLEENPALYRLDDESDTTWELLSGTLTEGHASVPLSSFSIVGVWGEREDTEMTFTIRVVASDFVLSNRNTGAMIPEGDAAPLDLLDVTYTVTFNISKPAPTGTSYTPSSVTFAHPGLSLLDAGFDFHPACCSYWDYVYLDYAYTAINMPLLDGSEGGQLGMQLWMYGLLYNPQVTDFFFDQGLFAGNFVEVKTWRPRQGSVTVTGPTGSFTRSLSNTQP